MALPDVIDYDLDIVFCGSAVGDISNTEGAYYADPRNCFWQALLNAALTPRKLTPSEYRRLLEDRMGLTDLVKSVSGNDRTLTKDQFDLPRFRALILKFRPRIVAFTGKKPAKEFLGVKRLEYGQQREVVGQTLLFVLPSPSGNARRYWSEAPWQELYRLRSELAGFANKSRQREFL